MSEARRTELRVRLGDARVMLLFTPDVCPPGRDPEDVLAELWPAGPNFMRFKYAADGKLLRLNLVPFR